MTLKQIQRWDKITVHELKILPEYFNAAKSGAKKFEIRYNDRNFVVGDELHLREFKFNGHYDSKGGHSGEYTGRRADFKITYILYGGFGLQEGYCVMSIVPVKRKRMIVYTKLGEVRDSAKLT